MTSLRPRQWCLKPKTREYLSRASKEGYWKDLIRAEQRGKNKITPKKISSINPTTALFYSVNKMTFFFLSNKINQYLVAIMIKWLHLKQIVLPMLPFLEPSPALIYTNTPAGEGNQQDVFFTFSVNRYGTE